MYKNSKKFLIIRKYPKYFIGTKKMRGKNLQSGQRKF